MPTTKSAKKRHRQSLERRATNRATKSQLKTQLRKVTDAVTAGDQAKTDAEFRLLCKKLDKAAAGGVIHRNLSARVKSRVSARVKAAKKPKAATA